MSRVTGAGREAVAHLQQQQKGGSQTSNHKSAATTNFQLAAGDWVKMSVLRVSLSLFVFINDLQRVNVTPHFRATNILHP